MSAQMNRSMGPICVPPTEGHRVLLFPDGSKAAVVGLDEIFQDAYAEGRRPDASAAGEMVTVLSRRNYVPDSARREYEWVVLREYRSFCEARKKEET